VKLKGILRQRNTYVTAVLFIWSLPIALMWQYNHFVSFFSLLGGF